LAISSHHDRVLAHHTAEPTGPPLWHYADYPYLVYSEHTLTNWLPANAEAFSLEISPSGLKA